MKHRFLLFFIIFCFNVCDINAQVPEKNAFYHSGELSGGNYFGLNLNANYVRDEKYSFQLGYSVHLRSAKDKPDDYSSGLIGVLLFGLANPTDQIENFQVLTGRVIQLNSKGTLRLNLLAGIGLSIIKEPVNWEYMGSSFVGQKLFL